MAPWRIPHFVKHKLAQANIAMKYISPRDFTNIFFKHDTNPVDAIDRGAPLGEAIRILNRQRDEREAYAHLNFDFTWGMPSANAEALLYKLQLKPLAEYEFESNMPIRSTLWHRTGLLGIAEDQRGSWFCRFEFEINNTNANILPGGGSRHPIILPNGDCIARCSYHSDVGVRPLLEVLMPHLENAWIDHKLYVRNELGEFERLAKEIIPTSPAEQAYLLIRPNEPNKSMEELMRLSAMELCEQVEGFSITKHKGVTRFWKQAASGRLSSYHGTLQDAKRLWEQESKILSAAEAAGADNWERNNNQFQESSHVSFQIDGRLMKGRLENHHAVIEPYC